MSDTAHQHIPLSDRLRPTEPRHLMVSDGVLAKLQAMLAQHRPMNLTFCGPPGHGKTSAARMIIDRLGAELIELEGNSLRKAADVREKVTAAATTASLFGVPRIVFIDEAGGMTKAADKALRIAIEQAVGTTRFILCANDSRELSGPILSRCPEMRLRPWPWEEEALLQRWIPDYLQRLRDANVEFDEPRVIEIIRNRYPDIRAAANDIEMEFELMKMLDF